MTKYFKYQFAEYGDKIEIPDGIQSSGTVSYQAGFPVDYQRKLGVDPLAKPVPRQGFNGIISDITGALKQYQENGFYNFISPEMNDGKAFDYSMGATVRYDMSDAQDGSDVRNFTSLINRNKGNPKDSPENWQEIGQSDIEFATNEEILNEVEGKAIDPKGLASVKATAKRRGLIQIASEEVFEGKINNTQAITTEQFYRGFDELSKLKYTVIYPQGTAENPFIIGINDRIVVDNPFGENDSIFCEVQLYLFGEWGSPGNFTLDQWTRYGTGAHYLTSTNKIIIQTAPGGLAASISSWVGSPFGHKTSEAIAKAPVRLRVWSV